MRGFIVAVSLFGLLASLSGCEGEPKASVAKENPPPKPPNCPELPELKNIRLVDGSIADVRIVQFVNTKLYFPTDWLEDSFTDLDPKTGWQKKSAIGFAIPDINRVECPGVIHKVDVQQPIPLMTLRKNKQFQSKKSKSFPVIVDMFHISPNPPKKERNFSTTHGGYYSSKIYPMPDLMVFISWGVLGGNFDIDSPSIEEMIKWLSTPPNQRDNDKKFMISVNKATQK